MEACVHAAAKCCPPFPEKEVRKLVNRVYLRYEQGGKTSDDDASDRATILDRLERTLHLRVARVIKYGKSQATFAIVLTDGREIVFPDTAALLGPVKAQAVIADATNHIIPIYKRGQWLRLVSKILLLAETVSTSETNTDTRGWIQQALEGDMPGSLIDLNDPIAKAYQLRSWQKDSTGFRATDRRFYIRLAPFRKFIDFHVERRTGQKDITTRLARLGFEESRLQMRDPEDRAKMLTARFWVSPAGFDPQADE